MALRIKYNSPLVLTFSLICAIVYTVNYFTAGSLRPVISLSSTFNPSSVISYITLITYTFGHSGIDHLVGNLSFLLLLGPIMEEKYGGSQLFFMMLITAIVTGIFNILFLSTGLWGASGIVFMFIILVSFVNTDSGTIPITFIVILILYVGREIINSLEADNVSQFAHIAGGIIGSIFGFVVKKKS